MEPHWKKLEKWQISKLYSKFLKFNCCLYRRKCYFGSIWAYLGMFGQTCDIMKYIYDFFSIRSTTMENMDVSTKYLENQIFPRHAVFAGLCRTLSWINLENFRNILWLVSEKNTKNHIFWHFSHFFPRTRFFPKNRAPSHFSYYDPLTSCQISERSYV